MSITLTSPGVYNFDEGLPKLIQHIGYTSLLAGLGAVFMFLKKSPIPDIPAGSLGLAQDHVLIEPAPPVMAPPLADRKAA